MAGSEKNKAKEQTARIAARTAKMQRLNRASKPRAPKKAKRPEEPAATPLPQFAKLPAELQIMVFEYALIDWLSYHSKINPSTRNEIGSSFIIRHKEPDPTFAPYDPTLGYTPRIPTPNFRLNIGKSDDAEAIFLGLYSDREFGWAPLHTCSIFRQVTLRFLRRQEWPAQFIENKGEYTSKVFQRMKVSKYTAEHRHWMSKRMPIFLIKDEELQLEETTLVGYYQGPWKAKIVKRHQTSS